jgi:hypothetical protein
MFGGSDALYLSATSQSVQSDFEYSVVVVDLPTPHEPRDAANDDDIILVRDCIVCSDSLDVLAGFSVPVLNIHQYVGLNSLEM